MLLFFWAEFHNVPTPKWPPKVKIIHHNQVYTHTHTYIIVKETTMCKRTNSMELYAPLTDPKIKMINDSSGSVTSSNFSRLTNSTPLKTTTLIDTIRIQHMATNPASQCCQMWPVPIPPPHFRPLTGHISRRFQVVFPPS
jgi:hypothetical protein